MEKGELEKVIKQLESEYPEEKKQFGCYFMDGQHENDLYIAANLKGLYQFAARILRAADSLHIQQGIETGPIDTGCSDISADGDYPVRYIKAFRYKIENPNEDVIRHETWKDKMGGYAILLFLFFLLLCVVWGFISIIKSIFSLF